MPQPPLSCSSQDQVCHWTLSVCSHSAYHAGNGCTMEIDDMAGGTMQLLLEWIYGGLEDRPSLPEAIALFQAAHKYDIPELQHQCEKLMGVHVNLHTYPQLMDLAYRHYASVLGQVNMPWVLTVSLRCSCCKPRWMMLMTCKRNCTGP